MTSRVCGSAASGVGARSIEIDSKTSSGGADEVLDGLSVGGVHRECGVGGRGGGVVELSSVREEQCKEKVGRWPTASYSGPRRCAIVAALRTGHTVPGVAFAACGSPMALALRARLLRFSQRSRIVGVDGAVAIARWRWELFSNSFPRILSLAGGEPSMVGCG
jgi:hypothetical protein